AAAVHLYTTLRKGAPAEDAFAVERTAVRLVFAFVVAGITFRICQPYAFQGPSFLNFSFDPRWLDNMKYIRDLISGAIDYPPSHQWTNRTAFLYPWRNMVVWGMGLPLGLTAWAGWALALVQILRGRWRQHLLPWTWATLVFLYHGPQFVKTMRYFLPMYPFLIMLGAYLLVWLWDAARSRVSGFKLTLNLEPETLKLVSGGLAVFVLVATFLWAFAFTRIYTRPHSRIQASRWIYAHIPAGATLAFEHWDDPLPLGVDGKSFEGTYKSVEMKLYDDDNEEKRRQLIEWLDRADTIILSSNRLYGSIPRLPMRYPLTTEYYRLLFAGQLGFRLEKVVTSYPNLGPLRFNDDSADEAFTVYDHPKVLIFQKTEDFSRARVEELLGRVSLDNVLRLTPKQAMAAPTGLMLSPEEWEAQQRGGTWSAMFNRRSLINRHGWLALLVWWLAVELVGLVAFPIAFVVFRNLPDRGYVLSKILGLLLVAYLAWLAASLRLLPYTRPTILLALALVALLSGCLAWRRRERIVAFWRRGWRLILINEALFAIFFLAFLLIRLGNPDLWHPAMGGEKPMDLAYLNAVMKSTYFPPYDPWFAGGYINYYYFGFVLVGTLIKLTGIVPWVAYNLTIPLLFALTAMGAFCVVYNLTERREERGEGATRDSPLPSLLSPLTRGVLGSLFVAVIGNLGEVKLILDGLVQVSGSQFRSTIPGLAMMVKVLLGLSKVLFGDQGLPFRIEWWYWNPTRVIPDTINEFPFFTFLYADLHAHGIALPLTLLALAMAVNIVKHISDKGLGMRDEGAGMPGPSSLIPDPYPLFPSISYDLGNFLVFSLVLGALRPTNTWDYPTYLLIALGALAIREVQRRGRVDRAGLWAVAWRFGLIVVLSALLFWPYQARYAAAYTSLELWKGARTKLMDYLVVHGFFLFILVTFLGVEAQRWVNQERDAWREWLRAWVPLAPYVIGFLALLTLLFALKHLWLFLFLLPLLGLAGLLLLREAPPERRFVLGLILVGLALSLGVEVVVLKGDIGRMNTAFKFYLQIWVL
ncbi:MAG TPA: hypothetical protein EYP55_05395, partial [Anaerolineae bacterium]|nr:hypothetical protein [Anaerolineae bacterium]